MNQQEENLPMGPYRVLDLTDEKGYFCGKILADLGADVIKIEPPGGDPGRNIGPFHHDSTDKNKSLFFFSWNTSKKSITLNIETPEGQKIFRKLAKAADFVIESFSPGHMEKLGLGYSALKGINPRIIVVSITPFGQTGPRKDWKAPDIVAVGMGGLSLITGNPDRPPARVSIDQAHVIAGSQAAMGAMIAHYYRQASGAGQHVDVSIQQCVVPSALSEPQVWDLQKVVRRREGAFLPRSGKRVRHLWPCKDGYVGWRIFGGGLGFKTRALVDWMESEGAAEDLPLVEWEKMDYPTVSLEEFNHWQDVFVSFFKSRTKAELCSEALKRGIVLFPASTPKDLLEDPQLKARDFWEMIDHPELQEEICYPGAFYKSTEISWKRCRAPLIGEHNHDVYEKELGYSAKNVEALKRDGVV